MRWHSPVPYRLIPTDDSESFRASFAEWATGLPVFPHKGAFAVPRKFHVHEGVDIYVPEGTRVSAVERGRIVAISPFTGLHALTPWWEETWVVMVEGPRGVVAYGEIVPLSELSVGDLLAAQDTVGHVKRVLRVDRGRPMSMLHLELHVHGTTRCEDWKRDDPPPPSLRDPTPHLLNAHPHLLTPEAMDPEQAWGNQTSPYIFIVS